jgi:micrococcal nuclease
VAAHLNADARARPGRGTGRPTSYGRGAIGFIARLVLTVAALAVLHTEAQAHRDGCHRWHSCESDRGTSVCGDLGHCSQCPDNEFCEAGRPRAAAGPPVGVPTPEAPARAPTPGTALEREPATVVRVVGGDTVDVRVGGRVERVRLIGLDTPESVDPRRPVECFGREASRKARELLPAGQAVQLEADPTQGDRDSTRSRRLLRYIWLPDGRNVAEVMIAEGYGFEFAYRLPYRYQERFRAAQRAAREAGRGLWAPGACG